MNTDFHSFKIQFDNKIYVQDIYSRNIMITMHGIAQSHKKIGLKIVVQIHLIPYIQHC